MPILPEPTLPCGELVLSCSPLSDESGKALGGLSGLNGSQRGTSIDGLLGTSTGGGRGKIRSTEPVLWPEPVSISFVGGASAVTALDCWGVVRGEGRKTAGALTRIRWLFLGLTGNRSRLRLLVRASVAKANASHRVGAVDFRLHPRRFLLLQIFLPSARGSNCCTSLASASSP